MKVNIVADKSMQFAVRIVNAYKLLVERKEFVLSKQMLRSGTSIGANVRESSQAQSKLDFISKLGIALKECNETKYWIELLNKTEYFSDKEYHSLNTDCNELFAILTAIIKTSKGE